MKAMAADHPHYGWVKNKGYPTKAHREAIRIHGVTMEHRRTFKGAQGVLFE